MKHKYLTHEEIQKSLVVGKITYRKAFELTAILEKCARSLAVRHGNVILHKVAQAG